MKKISGVKAGVLFWIIAWILVMILFGMFGCALTGGASTTPALPATAWESTMNAVAKTNWFGTFCLFSFFGGVVAVGLEQRKIGFAVIIAAICTICLGLAIHRFPTWLAVTGLMSSILAVSYSVLKHKKALVEVVRGVQRYRESDAEHIDAQLHTTQSATTEKIVKKIKDKNAHTRP